MIWKLSVVLFNFFHIVAVSSSPFRLPTAVKPHLYKIQLNLSLTEETFTGTEKILVHILNTTESITFHSSNLNITDIYINNYKVENIDFFQEYEKLTIWNQNNNSLIVNATYEIKIYYKGQFSKPSSGLFKANITYGNESRDYVVATDLEPTYARTVFPCFDEPSFKAEFELSLIVPNNSYKVISNTKPKNKTRSSKGVKYEFEKTPIMPTYLLSFSVNLLEYSTYSGSQNISIRAFSANSSEKNKNILSYVDQCLKYYTCYTNFKYPINKIDLIEFDRNGSWATENWGLITMASGLLSTGDNYFEDNQKFAVISHEIAHYWFGNLVTNDWWDDIWLQEGLATFMALKAGDAIRNDSSTANFGLLSVDDLFYSDIEGNSPPVVNYEVEPAKIQENFNDITYTKAAAIMRMIENVLGEQKLQCALSKYIRIFQYKSARNEDFINILKNFSENAEVFSTFVNDYLHQVGYPILNVTDNRTHYIIEQTTYSNLNKSTNNRWTVPLTYITNLSSIPKSIWFYKEMETLAILKNKSSWIKFNHNQLGYYRVFYSNSLQQHFFSDDTNLDDSEISHLIRDATAMLLENKSSCDVFLNYLEHIDLESFLAPVHVSYIRIKESGIFDLNGFKLFLKYLIKLFQHKHVSILSPLHKLLVEENDFQMLNYTQRKPETNLIKDCKDWMKSQKSRN